MLARGSSMLWRFALTRIFRCRKRFTIKNSSVKDRVAVTPLAISHMPKSVVLSTFAVNVSSKHVNSQHEFPCWNDLHPCGGVQSTFLQEFTLACPSSHMHNLRGWKKIPSINIDWLKKKCFNSFDESFLKHKFKCKSFVCNLFVWRTFANKCLPANIRTWNEVVTRFDAYSIHVMAFIFRIRHFSCIWTWKYRFIYGHLFINVDCTKQSSNENKNKCSELILTTIYKATKKLMGFDWFFNTTKLAQLIHTMHIFQR